MTDNTSISQIADADLLRELRSRGYVVSAWSKEDLIDMIADDDDCEDLTEEQVLKAAELAFGRFKRLDDVLAQSGNDYTAERWLDYKDEVLAELKATAPTI